MISLVLAVHLLVVFFGEAPAGELAASERAWWDTLWSTHAVMAVVGVVLLGLTALSTRVLDTGAEPGLVARWIGELTYAAYLAMGVASSLNDQRQFSSNVNAYVIAVLVPPLVFRLRLAPVLILHATSLVAFLYLLPSVQPSEAARLSVSVISPIIALLGGGLAYALTSFARTEGQKRMTLGAERAAVEAKGAEVEGKRGELEALNADLERRVAEQVREIVAHAREVDALNAQLMERVQERSRELSSALARLAKASGDSAALAPGSRLGGRVTIESVLGQGGMGVVYRGHDSVTDLAVAVKVVQPASVGELDNLQRFLLEARAAASVNHPAIVRTLHVDVSEDGGLFQIQELVVGKPLDRVLGEDRALPIGTACRIGGVLAEALAAAHASDVVHRDVKPANILLVETGAGLKLLDFGISKIRAARGEHPPLTREGPGVGPPAFMAPGQIPEPARVRVRTAVYAAAMVVYHALAGRSPFGATSAPFLLAAHVAVDPEPLASLVPDAPSALVTLIHAALSKSPDERPTAAELAEGLHAIADGLGTAPLPALVTALELAPPRSPRAAEVSAMTTRQPRSA